MAPDIVRDLGKLSQPLSDATLRSISYVPLLLSTVEKGGEMCALRIKLDSFVNEKRGQGF